MLAVRRNHVFAPVSTISKASLPQFLTRFAIVFTCTAVLLFSACGCAQGQSNSPENAPSANSESSVSANSSDETFADASPDDLTHSESSSSSSSASSSSASPASSASSSSAATPASSSAAHTASTPLEKAWEADFKRLAKASGMDVSVSALNPATGESVAYRSDKKMLSASMIKLLIAEAFLKQVSEGKQKLEDTYTLKESDIVGGTGSLGGRGAGAKVVKREMLKLMITESDNVAANVLIDLCGMDEINAETEMNDPDSLWNEVRRLIALRKQHPSLSGRSDFRMINYHGYPLVYERSSGTEQILVILNPSRNDIRTDTDTAGTVLYNFADKELKDHMIPAQSAFIIKR